MPSRCVRPPRVKLDDPQLAILDLYNRTFTFTFTGIEKGEARYGFHAGDNTRATVWKTRGRSRQGSRLRREMTKAATRKSR
jgi:hypothetical protein